MIDRIIVDLSGGEQQRVALARALAKNADLYLFDEPLSNLDPKLRAQARRDIVMVHRIKQKPTIYVTHDQTEALAIGDRIAVIASGRLQQVGTATDLIEHPANLFVAGFIGSPPMNLIPATVERETCQVRLENGALLQLPEKWRGVVKDYPNSSVIVGIPPSAILPPHLEQDAADSLSPLKVNVESVEPLVAELIVLLRLEGDLHVSAIFQGINEEEYLSGRSMILQVDGRQLCLFDPQTQAALQPES